MEKGKKSAKRNQGINQPFLEHVLKYGGATTTATNTRQTRSHGNGHVKPGVGGSSENLGEDVSAVRYGCVCAFYYESVVCARDRTVHHQLQRRQAAHSRPEAATRDDHGPNPK